MDDLRTSLASGLREAIHDREEHTRSETLLGKILVNVMVSGY